MLKFFMLLQLIGFGSSILLVIAGIYILTTGNTGGLSSIIYGLLSMGYCWKGNNFLLELKKYREVEGRVET